MASEAVRHSRVHAWGKLLFFSFLIWAFGWVIGPYMETHIPTCNQIAKVVEERDIDSAAYMYTDEVGSYEGEYYLNDSLTHSQREDYGFTKSFISGIVLCFLILGFGWRFIM